MSRMSQAGALVLAAGALACACQREEEASPPGLQAPPVEVRPPVAQPLAPPPAEGAGSLEGEVLLVGEPPMMPALKRGTDPVCAKAPPQDEQVLVKDGKLQNVVLRLADAPAAAPPAEPAVVDQLDCVYRPRVLVAMEGQKVLVRNSDGTLHNVHAYGVKPTFNRAQPPRGPALEAIFKHESDVVKLKCDVHPWMISHVVYSKSPHFAVTGPEGRFELEAVPAGTYTLQAWHERFGTKAQRVTVERDGVAKVTVRYSVDDRG